MKQMKSIIGAAIAVVCMSLLSPVAVQAEPPTIDLGGNKKISFGGQYRINFFSAYDNAQNTAVSPNNNDKTAARLRIRQNIDIQYSEHFKSHLMLELQHTRDNVITTNTGSAAGGAVGPSTRTALNSIEVRHAVMEYTSDLFNMQAGIVPLSDHFHDTLFSADWDYNPLALSVIAPVGPGKLRVFAANLAEGSENNKSDDFIHYQADYVTDISSFIDGATLTLSGTALNIADPNLKTNDSWHFNYGGALNIPVDMGTEGFNIDHINIMGMGSTTDTELLPRPGVTPGTVNGGAALVEVTGTLGPGKFGILGSYASGKKDGTGFQAPMAFAQTFGYWGYTGLLTVQGPTDTAFDGDGVNISNNGYGLASVQVKYAMPLMKVFDHDLDLYLAAGWFGATNASDNTTTQTRDSTLGGDFLGMFTYHFTKELALDFGVAYAILNDSVSPYFAGVAGGPAAINGAQGSTRNRVVGFGRLQMETF